MTFSLRDKKLVIMGGSSGIGLRLAADAVAAGATVILAGRDRQALDARVAGMTDTVGTAHADLGDEDSIAELAERTGELDYLVSLASAPASGPVTGLPREAIARAFDAKVIGPILLAKHFAPRFRPGGAILLFSGIVAWRPEPGLAVMATTNGAVDFLARALAVELAPVRVNALSPGIVDSGAWDGMGQGKDRFFADRAARNPARRIGRPADISSAALLALTNPFLTGSTLHVDGGGRLA
jgi:NAD(P)-dependent dehydrogenase (short-subunit alcohol dehydrogenase family)